MPTTYIGGGEYRITCSSCDREVDGVFYPSTPDANNTRTGQRVSDFFSFSTRRQTFRNRCRNCEREQRRNGPRATRSRRVASAVLGLGRRFGVELELIFPAGHNRATISAALEREGVRGWRVKSDGSLSGGNGWEVVSPVLAGEQGIETVRTACRVLTRLGAKPNRSCGMHVHHEARDLTVSAMKALARTWSANQGVIDGLVSPSRRNGGSYYCRPLNSGDLAAIDAVRDLRSLSRLDRYRTLNLASYGRHGTVEIRQHQGTCDPEKVVSWIRFGQGLIDTAIAQGEVPAQSRVRDLFDRMGDRLDETARTFLTGRAVEFGAVTV